MDLGGGDPLLDPVGLPRRHRAIVLGDDQCQRRLQPRHVAGALAMMANWDLYGFERELPKLKTPLALIVAENDRAVPPGQADWVKQRVATAEIHRIPGLGHLAAAGA
jgi:pimeloyl-ACP methyl ester carboxylesterase